MSQLTCKTVRYVNVQDFEAFVKSAYDIDHYDFLEVQSGTNMKEYRFIAEAPAFTYLIADLKDFIADNRRLPYQSHHLLFDLLVDDGHIEPGTYVVRA